MRAAYLGGSPTALPAISPGATFAVEIGAISVQSPAVNSEVARLVATVDCHVAIGADPVASAAAMLLPAGVPEYFTCRDTDKIAVIQEAGPGTLYITAAA